MSETLTRVKQSEYSKKGLAFYVVIVLSLAIILSIGSPNTAAEAAAIQSFLKSGTTASYLPVTDFNPQQTTPKNQ